MATKKKTRTPIKQTTPSVETSSPVNPKTNYRFFIQIIALFLLGTAAFLLAKKYRGLVIAATVNKTPITRFELEIKLNERYAKSTLDELINNALLQNLAKENGVSVTNDDLGKERKSIEDRLGGAEALNKSLEQYGMTETDFYSRLRSVILERKLSEKLFKAEIAEDEVKKFFDDNKLSFGTQTFEQAKEQIKDNLLQQQLQQQFGTWFTDQKSKAQIKNYL